MKLFAGLSRTDYQDLFRAIGAMLDEEGLRDVRIWEHADGMVVQGRRSSEGEYESIVLGDDSLQSLLGAVYERRTA
jgi:hypothetical protein